MTYVYKKEGASSGAPSVVIEFLIILAYKYYEYPFSGVLGKNSLKKLVV